MRKSVKKNEKHIIYVIFVRREEASWGEAGGGGQAEVRPRPGGHDAQHNHQPQGYWGEYALDRSVFTPSSGFEFYLWTLSKDDIDFSFEEGVILQNFIASLNTYQS